MTRAMLKPANCYIVRTPFGDIMPPEGLEVPLTTYWRRRLAAGDVVTVPVKKSEAKK